MHARASAVTTAALVACCLLSTAAPVRAGDPPVVVAHRGASGEAPENTLAAVDRARAIGAEWVENDIQRTKDGELVVIHDTDLKRTTDAEKVFPGRAPWKVGDFTAAEIARLDAGSWKDARFKGTRVPTLEQYLNRAEHNGQSILMEVKAPELYPRIENDIIRTLGEHSWLDRDHVAHRLIVQSFSADSVRAVHTLRPDLKTGFLGTPSVADLPRYAAFTDQINPDHKTISADYVKAVHALKGAHGKKLETYTWTVNDSATARQADGYGVDGIISNRPDVVAAAVHGRAAATR